MKTCLEYVWIDAFGNTRSKIKVIDIREFNSFDINTIPEWNFDGSSTGQAEGKDSDIILKPEKLYPNPFITWCNSFIVLWNFSLHNSLSNRE